MSSRSKLCLGIPLQSLLRSRHQQLPTRLRKRPLNPEFVRKLWKLVSPELNRLNYNTELEMGSLESSIMNPDLDSGLFGIQLSDSEDSNNGSGPAEGNPPKKSEANTTTDRTTQSEEEFQTVRKEYKVKIENGEIWKTIKLPLGSERIPKPQAQALLHAVEELYFFRRYTEGARFVKAALGGNRDDSNEDIAPGLDDDTRNLLRYYERKCDEKAGHI